ncbi:MAG: alkene reductase [Pseudomonadota bacterium]
MAAEDLFEPVQIGDLSLPNRIVMAPLTRSRAQPDNTPGELAARYYAQRASAGLIVSEGVVISRQGVGYPNVPGLYTDEHVRAWQPITEAVHAAGGRIFAQIWHVGRISLPEYQPDGALPVAPSAVCPKGHAFTWTGPKPFVTPRALDIAEIPLIVAQYRDAAARALQAGFDGVEIHGANGYLIDQFLRDGTNRRTDAYGGSIENRLRFLTEVVEAVIEAVPAQRVGVRISPASTVNDMSDSDPQALFNAVAERLSRYALAYLHAVEWAPNEDAPPDFDFQALRRRFGGSYIANGHYDRARALQARAEDRADLISFGRLYIANPDLVARLAQDAPLNTPDPATFYGGDAHGYTDYPAL